MTAARKVSISVTERARRSLQKSCERFDRMLGDQVTQSDALEILDEIAAAALHADVVAAVVRIRVRRATATQER